MPENVNGLDQFVTGLSPSLQLIINMAVLMVAVAAAAFGYSKKGSGMSTGASPSSPVDMQVGGGAMDDRASMQDLAAAIREIAAELRASRADAIKRHADDAIEDRVAELVGKQMRVAERAQARKPRP